VERDKPNKSESVGQTLPQLPRKQKIREFKKNVGFLSSNFMKLCRNIHRSVWQLLGVEKIQNGNQGAKIVKFIPNFKKLYSNVSCHMQICKQIY
jgi:hypothetical protein